MKITLTANTDWYLYNFRLDLANALRESGHEVSMVCPDGEYADKLREDGFEVRIFSAPASGFSIAANQRALTQIQAAFKSLEPDVVHLFTPICVLLGAIAARRNKIPGVIAALTGMGHVFTSHSLKARVARPGLRWLFQKELHRKGTAVIFQNEADREEFISAGVVRPSTCHLIRGSGVNPDKFQPRANPRKGDEVRIVFASRLLQEKGLSELLTAFVEVRENCPGTELWIAGEPYPANPTSLTSADVEEMAEQPRVRMLGHVSDMPGLLAEADIVALPSYREGTPKILLEAAACGLPIVASDIAGCRGVVEEGVNGFLVPVKDTELLADRLKQLCLDPKLRQTFGQKGREIILQGFTSDAVVQQTLAVYGSIQAKSAG